MHKNSIFYIFLSINITIFSAQFLDIDEQLIYAAKVGDIELVQKAIDAKADINWQDREQSTALHHAARNGHDQIIQLLIEYNVNQNIMDENQKTALDLAIENDNVSCVELLYSNSQKPIENFIQKIAAFARPLACIISNYITDTDKTSPTFNLLGNSLVLAIKSKSDNLVKLILSKKIEESSLCNLDEPLSTAIDLKNPELVKMLLAAGAKFNRIRYIYPLDLIKLGDLQILQEAIHHTNETNKKSLEESLLNHAIEIGNNEMAQIIIKLLPNAINSSDYSGLPIVNAAKMGNLEVIQIFQQLGFDLTKLYGRSTLLHHACENFYNFKKADESSINHEALIKYLIDARTDINAQDNNKETPLHIAAQNRNPEIARLLLLNKADLNQKNNNGQTPLVKSLEDVFPKCHTAMLLIENGAQISAQEIDAFLMLPHVAWRGDRPDLLKYLIDAKADLKIKRHNSTALHLAAEEGNVANIKILLDAKADKAMLDNSGNTIFARSGYSGNLESINLLYDSDVDTKEMTKFLFNALSRSYKDKKDAIQFALKHKADVNGNNSYKTVIQYALWNNNHPETISQLIDLGADINVPDEFGKLPIHTASEHCDISVIKLLLDKKADINASYCDKTPLTCAINRSDKQLPIIDFLLKYKADVKPIKYVLKRANGETYNCVYRPLEKALSNSDPQVVKLLLDAGALDFEDDTLFNKYSENHNKHLNLLFDYGFDHYLYEADAKATWVQYYTKVPHLPQIINIKRHIAKYLKLITKLPPPIANMVLEYIYPAR